MSEQKTIYKSDLFRVVTENAQEGPVIWLADDLDEVELNFTRDEMRDILPALIGWLGDESKPSVNAELLAAAEQCESLLLSHGDPLRGDDWQAMQDVRAAIKNARADAPTARGADAIALAGELRQALWDILYADQDNQIPAELFQAAKALIDKADATT